MKNTFVIYHCLTALVFLLFSCAREEQEGSSRAARQAADRYFVPAEKARQTAINFASRYLHRDATAHNELIEQQLTISENGKPVMYVFNYANEQGFRSARAAGTGLRHYRFVSLAKPLAGTCPMD